MKISGAFPAGAALGGDFVSRHNNLKPGERIVDFQIDLEALPGWGWLCITETTVKGIVRELGLDMLDRESADKMRADRRAMEELRAENEKLRAALTNMIELAADIGLMVST